MTTVVPFPILRLSNSALQKVMQQLSLVERIYLSIVSNKMKQLIITTLNQRQNLVPLTLTPSSIQLRIVLNSTKLVVVNFKTDDPNFPVEIIESSRHESISSNLNATGMSVKQWIEHIVPVLCGNNGL